MTVGAAFVLSRHREAARRFHDIHAVGVMALDAVHFAFDDGMMLGEVKLGLGLQMTSEAGLGIFAGIDNELVTPVAAGSDVFAARAVAGLTTALTGLAMSDATAQDAGLASGLVSHLGFFQMQPRVRTCWKRAGNICMTVEACLVSHKRCAFDLQRFNHAAIQDGTGGDQ